MKRTFVTVGASVLLGVTTLAGPAVAAPADQSVVAGTGLHMHHVHTGSGCVEIGVPMEPGSRGLHGAVSAGTTHLEGGPGHGPCH